jgi:zinc/manganese transport system permease protein
LQILAIVRAMAAVCASIRGVSTCLSGAAEKLSPSERSSMDSWFLAPTLALLAGLAALAPLGVQVLARGVVFIDLAVAQAAAAAGLAAGALVDHPAPLVTQAWAAAGALLCAGLVAVLVRRWPQQREALIGLVYVTGASVAVLAARADPHGRDRLLELLAADLLWADWSQASLLAAVAVGVVTLQRLGARVLGHDGGFYPVFALVASIAVPVLGLFVVFVALIAPALWVRRGWALGLALAAAATAGALGLLASWAWDAPSGACVALALALWGAASAGAGRSR